MLPLHYWTGISAGVIYGTWVMISFYSQDYDIREQTSLLGFILLPIAVFPQFLQSIIVDSLIDWVPYNENWESIYNAVYHYGGYILSGIIFVLMGILLGKTSNDPQRDTRRRIIIAILLGVVVFAWMCYAHILAFFSN
jgi:hypothetical protein